VVDALLGAMAWGDIGEHFPNDDPKWRGAASRVFVEEVYRKVLAAGWSVQNLDVTILAERPKLKAFKPAMVKSIAQMLDVAKNQVNVKAGTNEGCDAIGRGEAIAAHAVILLGCEMHRMPSCLMSRLNLEFRIDLPISINSTAEFRGETLHYIEATRRTSMIWTWANGYRISTSSMTTWSNADGTQAPVSDVERAEIIRRAVMYAKEVQNVKLIVEA